MILLDTDIMIDVLREYLPAKAWLAALGKQPLLLPGFVVMELLQGCQNKAEQTTLMSALTPYRKVWPSESACERALSVFEQYHLSHNLGMLDALIGQTALSLSLPVHTFNRKHYAVIPGLRTVQPYTK